MEWTPRGHPPHRRTGIDAVEPGTQRGVQRLRQRIQQFEQHSRQADAQRLRLVGRMQRQPVLRAGVDAQQIGAVQAAGEQPAARFAALDQIGAL